MKKELLYIVALLGLLTSCIRAEIQGSDTPSHNFEMLWKIMDEHYCFFAYKAENYGLDWNEVHERYSKRISSEMNNRQLFEVLGEMLGELKDGHVNLYAAHDVARNWSWKEDYPRNFNENIQRVYMGTDYGIASGLRYKILEDNIGYIYCESFSSGIGSGNVSQTLSILGECTGLIVDIRENGGGSLDNANTLASYFTNERILTGYICHKTGKGHDEFSELKEVWLNPAEGKRWQKKVVVLTNRSCYSAANDFVNSMKTCPQVTIMGDRTGGGSGLPFSSELPNGWSIRFSASPSFDAEKKQIEFGIEPDIKVDLLEEDIQKNKDTLIESAREFLKK